MTTSIVVALTLGVCASSAETSDTREEKARSLYQQGISAMNDGKYDLAKMSFREVLRIYPTHPQAKRHLLHLNSNRSSLEVGKRKKVLRQVIIPKFDLDKASVQESMEMLSAHVKQASSNKVDPNFIVQDRTGAFAGKTVTLNLSNVPAETLLGYIVDQVGAIARYDSHAIVIKPRQKSGTGE